MDGERLHKIMAARGVASRRACEELIKAGRVTVDGKVVTMLGTRVSEDADIRVDGNLLHKPQKVYYILNKPKGYLTTLSDDRGRKTVGDIVARLRNRVHPVGRLDLDSEGLLILCNDGWLTNVLTHPRYEIEKTYAVNVRGRMTDESIGRLRTGIPLREGRAAAKVRIVKRTRESTALTMTISRGYNRQIRRMCAAVAHNVTRLRRVAVGPLRLTGLSSGQFRRLKAGEVAALKAAALEAQRRAGDAGPRE